jgi:hypothetical protein
VQPLRASGQDLLGCRTRSARHRHAPPAFQAGPASPRRRMRHGCPQ